MGESGGEQPPQPPLPGEPGGKPVRPLEQPDHTGGSTNPRPTNVGKHDRETRTNKVITGQHEEILRHLREERIEEGLEDE